MSAYDFDLFTIGAGSGGVRASRMAAATGAKVAVAEERHLGGTCVNIGCVPKKLMVFASHFAEDFEDAAGYGWTVGERRFDWSTLITNKNAEIGRLNGIYETLLSKAGVEIVEGRARLTGPNEVEVNGRRITAKHILIATGGKPTRPKEPGQELGLVSDDVFFLDRQPERVMVAGGGYIAVEFAGIFNGLGSQTIQLYRGPLFLRGFDDEIRTVLADEMRKKGVDLRFNTIISRIEKSAGGLVCHLSDGRAEEVDQVLYAIGRKPYTDDLGLDAAGVRTNDAGAVVVDDHFRTSVPHIYAIGDVIDRVNLTPVAIEQGMAIVRTVFAGEPTGFDFTNIPTAVFSQPPIGTVGLTEQEARQAGHAVDVYASGFRPMRHTMNENTERGFMKLVVERETDRVLGAHMVGPDAAEIVQGLGIALKCGATKAQFDATVGVHPTAAEEFVTLREKRPDPAQDGIAAD